MSGATQLNNKAPGVAVSRPPLSREQEYALAVEWRDTRSASAGDALIRSHMRFVLSTANKYRRYGLPVEELVAEGNFGLAHALRKFDPDRGFRFVTYAAYWVRAYILNYIIRSWSLVGSGSGALRSKRFFKLRRERARLGNLIADADEREQVLAERLDVSREQLRAMLRQLEVRDVSLDSKVFDDSGESLVDRLPSDDPDQESTLGRTQVQEHLRDAVRAALTKLDPREEMIVSRRLMADPEDKLSLAEIGRTLGVSRERARQLETRAKSKLRTHLSAMPDEARPEWLDVGGPFEPSTEACAA